MQLASKAKPNEAQTKQIVTVFTSALDGDAQRIQRHDLQSAMVILFTVREATGPLASAVLPAVDKISREASDDRIRNLAKSTADALRAADKSSGSDEVKKLREEVERLKREQADLRERLRKIEKQGKQ